MGLGLGLGLTDYATIRQRLKNLYERYRDRVVADAGSIVNETVTRKYFDLLTSSSLMGRGYISSGGAKTSLFEGRVVVDKVYDLHGVADQVFAGLDRPELLTWQLDTASWGVEKTSENKTLHNTELDNAYWGKDGVTISPNDIVAPNKTLTFDKIIEDTSTGNHVLDKTFADTDASVQNVLSFYAKAGERNIQVRYGDTSTADRAQINIDLNTGNTGNFLVTGNATNHSVKVILQPDGSYRIELTVNPNSTGNLRLRFHLSAVDLSSGSTSYEGDGVSGAYVWGIQSQTGFYATALMITGATTVTRTTPTPVVNDLLVNSGWFGGVVDVYLTGDKDYIFDTLGDSATERSILNTSSNKIQCWIYGSTGGTILEPLTSIGLSVSQRNIFAYQVFYDATTLTVCIIHTNGNIYKLSTAHSINTDTIKDIYIGTNNGGTLQRSQYQSAIESGDDAYSDAFAIEQAKKMTKGDIRFKDAVWEIQP